MSVDFVIALASAIVAALALVVSIAAAVPGFFGMWLGSRANDIAQDAVQKAEEANSIAAESQNSALRQEARATEMHDVEWEIGWIDAHHLFIENRGLDDAYEVRYWLTAAGSGPSGVPQTVRKREHMVYVTDADLDRSPSFGRDPVKLRITWRSASGAPHKALVVRSSDEVRARRLPRG